MKKCFDFYMEYLEEILKNDEKLSDFLSQDFSSQLLKKITSKIYKKVFPKTETKNDINFLNRLKTLQWLSYKHLNISLENQINDDFWKLSMQGKLIFWNINIFLIFLKI